MTTRTDEDLELELRSLPGVLSVSIAYSDQGDAEVVTLLMIGLELDALRSEAQLILSLYYPTATLVIEEANDTVIQLSRDHSRVAIVDAEIEHSTGTVRVTVQHVGRNGIGHSMSGPLIGGAEATLAALRDLGIEVPFSLLSVNSVSLMNRWPVVVTLRSSKGDVDRMGIALADVELLSSVKATLNALNRFLATPVRPG
jgi:hypothetical protein